MADEDLEYMRARSGVNRTDCGACHLEEQMTDEHREAFRLGLKTKGVNTTGILAWLEAKGYRLDRQAPRKVLINHRDNHIE
jgi:hypothetical protein